MSTSDLYAELRPRAFAIAYQMLGSVSEAEDVVQEAFLRLHQTAQRNEQIASPPAYLTTVVTRLSIDQLRSARARREQYVGEWLPEPLATESSPAERAEAADSLSLALMVLLESLTPQQRAAFLLRDVFQYPYEEVADILGTSVDGTRHLAARARNHLRERRPRYHASRQRREDLVRRFLAAAQEGDLSALEELLAQDAAVHVDGGGKVPAVTRPVNGRDRVARVMSAGMTAMARRGVRLQIVEVNGQPGAAVIDENDQLVGIMAFDIIDGQIQTIHSIANPDKLRHLDRDGQRGGPLRRHP
jgi:RNA polymerase sigma-70 factor (TIGR02957 family)